VLEWAGRSRDAYSARIFGVGATSAMALPGSLWANDNALIKYIDLAGAKSRYSRSLRLRTHLLFLIMLPGLTLAQGSIRGGAVDSGSSEAGDGGGGAGRRGLGLPKVTVVPPWPFGVGDVAGIKMVD